MQASIDKFDTRETHDFFSHLNSNAFFGIVSQGSFRADGPSLLPKLGSLMSYRDTKRHLYTTFGTIASA